MHIGYNKVDLKDLDKYLGKFELVINTIPANVLDNEKLKLFKEKAILINLPLLKETKIDINEANKLRHQIYMGIIAPIINCS